MQTLAFFGFGWGDYVAIPFISVYLLCFVVLIVRSVLVLRSKVIRHKSVQQAENTELESSDRTFAVVDGPSIATIDRFMDEVDGDPDSALFGFWFTQKKIPMPVVVGCVTRVNKYCSFAHPDFTRWLERVGVDTEVYHITGQSEDRSEDIEVLYQCDCSGRGGRSQGIMLVRDAVASPESPPEPRRALKQGSVAAQK